ncbi:MAG: sulfatase-like hydrolase/transferase [Clostridia bacterium]|nr:sulfatase-like hydrolase/transferase [Clostridia bacterium]
MIKSFWRGRILLTRARLITAAVMAFVSLLLCILVGGSLKAGIVFAIAFLAVVPFTVRLEFSPHVCVAVYGGLGLGFAVFTLLMSQLAVDQLVTNLPILQLLLGTVICLIPMLVIYAISLRFRLSVLIGSAMCMILTSINTYVYLFRGNELTPADLLSVGTAANVMTEYTFSIPKNLLFAWLLFFLMALFLFAIPDPRVSRRLWGRLSGAVAALLSVGMLVWGATGVTVHNWQNIGSSHNGFLLNFVLQLRYAFVTEPKGYDPKALDEFAAGYADSDDEVAGEYPDVIVIMNESFADLSVLGSEPNTDTPLLPFYRSLTENTIKGYALSSVLGGRTPNSEFEFLTGHTTAFLPAGSIPYQQYIQDPQYSVATVLANRGYSDVATHPNDGDNWMRESVWAYLGFERYTFIEDYPQKDLVRNYVSDAEMYQQVIRYYEEESKTGNVFLFGITMQNHGPYDYEDFPAEVSLQGYSTEYPDVEQYLTLINRSDAALAQLIGYFEQSERPVVVMMFGDHLPNLSQDFYKELHGGAFDSADEHMLQYKVPFMIWANYDIEEAFVECTSLNYLSNYLYEAMGMPLPPYNRFLKQLEEHIPAMNAFYYYSSEKDCYLPYENLSATAAEWIAWYRKLQYNCLFDVERRNRIFFPIDG